MELNYKTAVDILGGEARIPFDLSFDLSKLCSKYLLATDTVDQARDIIIRVQDAWKKIDPNTHSTWNDLTEAAGLYPYLETETLSGSGLMRYEYHKSEYLEDVYLHQEQQILANHLLSKQSVVVSAPTSFGKSLLIQEIVASKIYKNIVIIQPTLALLDETRKKLIKYKDSYRIIVSTTQSPSETKGNIFLFTGERVVEYAQFKTVDFFVIDEFYKLSLERDDDRAVSLNQGFNKLLKFTSKFYLLGPMIKDIPESFKEQFKFMWFPTSFSTVAVDVKNMEIPSSVKAKEKKERKKTQLFELLKITTEPTLIYCSSPNRATELCEGYVEFLKQSGQKPAFAAANNDAIEWISEDLNSKWSLNEALSFGAGFHHGALPRHLSSSIVDYFNQESVRWLFCTSTLIEGVNTSAKNVILFDKEKGKKPIDFFDYKNISGRSGRMNKHFIGNVIRFEKEPDQMELEVDIPLFNQENAPLEILVTLSDKELQPKVKPKLESFNKLPEDLKNILRKNSAISIDGQLEILKLIESNLQYYHKILSWKTTPPSFEHLATVIDLCWNNFHKPNDAIMFINSIGRLSSRWLTSFTYSYLINKSTKAVINQYINDPFWKQKISDDRQRINIATFSILHITRHWFDYKLPKWLSVISDLQEYIFTKNNLEPGSYSFLASSIEHSFLNPALASLMEYNIPISALNKADKLQRLYNPSSPPEQIIARLNMLTDEQFKKRGFLKYEIDKIRKAT